jgi:dTDP-4-dehydrorhamnose reductase
MLIILGANGMLGSYIYNYFLDHSYPVKAIYRSDFDVMIHDSDILEGLLLKKSEKVCSDKVVIFNAIGLISQKNNNDKDLLFRINGYFPRDLGIMCQKNNWKLIHPSTDCVFNGQLGHYNENSEPDAIDLYGISKSIADTFLKQQRHACIIRTSIIGENKSGISLLEWVKSNKNNTINGYTNHYWNGITCYQYAKILYNIISNNEIFIGIRHIYSNDISKYELVKLINIIFNNNTSTILPIEHPKFQNKCLVSNYTNYNESSIRDQLYELKNISKF